jgi:Co/Zn/Cd efflux system component
MNTAIAVACVGVVGTVLVALIEKSRRHNERDHAIVAAALTALKRN